jgi:hypothetical protein
MSARQGYIKSAVNPKAKYKVNYIRYMINGKQGVKKYITRKDNE